MEATGEEEAGRRKCLCLWGGTDVQSAIEETQRVDLCIVNWNHLTCGKYAKYGCISSVRGSHFFLFFFFFFHKGQPSPQTTPTIRYGVTARHSEFVQKKVSVPFEHQDAT